MRKIRILLIVFFSLTQIILFAQNCEDYNKSLFHMLPNNFPDKINCKDSLGNKQGWWINYVLKYNPVEKPDELPKGDYVENYSYGQYKDNNKVGEWISIANVHQMYNTRKDNYYYALDTIFVKSGFEYGGWNESTIYYNSDSSIIKSTSLTSGDQNPICIECNKNGEKGKECRMTYRNEKIKEFSFDQFDFEFYGSFIDKMSDKKMIDNKIDK